MTNSQTNGLILAGGKGSRLWPMTLSVSKQLLPVAGRPMIYFPLATLMLAGIRQITIVVSPESESQLKSLLKDGSHFGIELSYIVQSQPLGLAHGFGLAADNNEDNSTLAILGDNFFFGPKLGTSLRELLAEKPNTRVFAKRVKNPSSFGVLELRDDGSLKSLIEKPSVPPSDLIATGMYYFKPGDLETVNEIKPSQRGELEITDLLNLINKTSAVEIVELPRSTYWSDLGDTETLNQTQNYVTSIESTQKSSVLIPEVIALANGWLSKEQVTKIFEHYPGKAYKTLLDIELEGFQS